MAIAATVASRHHLFLNTNNTNSERASPEQHHRLLSTDTSSSTDSPTVRSNPLLALQRGQSVGFSTSTARSGTSIPTSTSTGATTAEVEGSSSSTTAAASAATHGRSRKLGGGGVLSLSASAYPDHTSSSLYAHQPRSASVSRGGLESERRGLSRERQQQLQYRQRSASNAGVLNSLGSGTAGSNSISYNRGKSQSREKSASRRSNSNHRSYSRVREVERERSMFVRARFNYVADDPTSLSFESGDIIQVMTRLESGWWDGVVNGQRGWFPSNYCELIEDFEESGPGGDDPDDSTGYASPDDDDDDSASGDGGLDSPRLPLEGTNPTDGDETGFWVPQATPEGRLYYVNTQTGVTRAELPLESPTSPTENGPRDGTVTLPESTRPPPEELLARGVENEIPDFPRPHDGDNDSVASEREGDMILLQGDANDHNFDDSKARFVKANGSSARNGGPNGGTRPRANTYNSITTNGSTNTLVTPRGIHGESATTSTSTLWNNGGAGVDDGFRDDNIKSPRNGNEEKVKGLAPVSLSPFTFYGENTNPTDWDALVSEIHHVVNEYKLAVRNGETYLYNARAHAISDRLRLLVAAGSGTTDNHSGHHPVITANRDYYPHFKRFMAAYSKLVLSTHLASGDWPPGDTETKCLAEADEVMNGVYAFAEAAKQQDKQIPRLRPGFIIGSDVSGGWKNSSVASPISSKHELSINETVDATAKLDGQLESKLEELVSSIKPAFRRLETTLKMPGPVITREQQETIGSFVLNAANTVVDGLRKYFNIIESINLAPFTQNGSQTPTFVDFITHKQRITDAFADLIMACQMVTAPLADEWSATRGDSLVDRLGSVRECIRNLENGMQLFTFTTQLLVGELEAQRNIETTVLPKATTISDAGKPLGSRGPRRRAESNAADSLPGKTSKEIQLLGPEAAGRVQNPPPPPPPAPIVPETPWYLGVDHMSTTEIQYGTKPAANGSMPVKGGTLTALVEQLTRHDYLDRDFVTTFLLTYQSFTTAAELFDQLARRFSIQPPVGLSPTELNDWTEKKQKLIRVRVFSTLKTWLESYWMEQFDEAGQELLKTILQFSKDVMLPSLPGASALVATLNERIRGQDPKQRVMVLNLMTNSIPPPILPKSLKKIKFLDVDPMEFARQLTIMESRLYQKIKPSEFLNKSWSNSSWDQAPNVKAMILHSNRLTNWVAEMILKQVDVKKRVSVIKHFISVAERCRQLNNFSTVTGIISALGSSPIFRLTRTWQGVQPRTHAILEEMRKLMGTTLNYAVYRENLHLVNPPCVPFLGVYLKDLTFVADGNPDFLKGTDLINFDKRSKTATIIQEIQQYQSVPYPLEPVEELQTYILSNMEMARDIGTALFEVSKELEPRPEREDEKIARLLQESGFL